MKSEAARIVTGDCGGGGAGKAAEPELPSFFPLTYPRLKEGGGTGMNSFLKCFW